jgi:hypothetical protein
VLLNGATPTELASCCPFVRETYAVDYVDFLGRFGDPDAALAGVPPDWDYVVDDERSRDPAQLEFAGLCASYQAAHRHFRARLHDGTAGAEPPAYVRNQQLELDLPNELRERVRDRLGAAPVRIALMPAGSSETSALSVHRFVGAGRPRTGRRGPDRRLLPRGKARTGRADPDVGDEGGLRAARGRRSERRLGRRPPAARAARVRGAVLPVRLAAHRVRTGGARGRDAVVDALGRAVARVVLQRWPFYSVDPDARRYPCFTQMAEQPRPAEDEGPRTPSMTRGRIEEDLLEVLEGARLLVEGRLGYEEALSSYFGRLLEAYDGDASRIFSFDGIHSVYI